MDVIKIFPLILLIFNVHAENQHDHDHEHSNQVRVSEADVQVEFYLMKTPFLYSILNCENVNLLSSINADDEIKILIHGYQENMYRSRDSMQLLAKGYLCNVFPKNVILVNYDWKSNEMHKPKYIYAYFKAYAELIALKINTFMTLIKKNLPGTGNNKMTLVGVGLGAQIASQVGQLQSKDDQLKAVIALDPAVPIFSLPPNLMTISKNDAKYVEIIHTSNNYGLYPGYGHSDVYINFADNQPPCESTFDVYCNHIYAVEVFADSLCMRHNYYLDRCILNDIIVKKCPQESIKQMQYLGDSPLYIKKGLYSSRSKFKPKYNRTSIMTTLVNEFHKRQYTYNDN